MLAMIGNGEFKNYREAIDKMVKMEPIASPDFKNREKLLKRFEIYKRLYCHLKDDFKEFTQI